MGVAMAGVIVMGDLFQGNGRNNRGHWSLGLSIGTLIAAAIYAGIIWQRVETHEETIREMRAEIREHIREDREIFRRLGGQDGPQGFAR